MYFGKYGPRGSSPRKLGGVPAAYWLWLRSQDFMYHHPELAEWIEKYLRLDEKGVRIPEPKKTSFTPRKSLPGMDAPGPANLKEFLKTL